MKINPGQDASIGAKAPSSPAADRAHGGNGAAPKSTPVAAGPGASVRLSELSSHLHALESSLATGDVFDPAKVAAIKQAIRDGTLTVNPEAVGDRMLAGLRDLFAKDH